ncbi:Peptidyl-prolyl cis-trans isomerase CYP59, partial [Cucurbita argyrosperma subsp. sororia]
MTKMIININIMQVRKMEALYPKTRDKARMWSIKQVAQRTAACNCHKAHTNLRRKKTESGSNVRTYCNQSRRHCDRPTHRHVPLDLQEFLEALVKFYNTLYRRTLLLRLVTPLTLGLVATQSIKEAEVCHVCFWHACLNVREETMQAVQDLSLVAEVYTRQLSKQLDDTRRTFLVLLVAFNLIILADNMRHLETLGALICKDEVQNCVFFRFEASHDQSLHYYSLNYNASVC